MVQRLRHRRKRAPPRDAEPLSVDKNFAQKRRREASQGGGQRTRRHVGAIERQHGLEAVFGTDALAKFRVEIVRLRDHEADNALLDRGVDQPGDFETRHANVVGDLRLGLLSDKIAPRRQSGLNALEGTPSHMNSALRGPYRRPCECKLAHLSTIYRSSSNSVINGQMERQHPGTQEFGARSTVHCALEGFQSIDLPFGLAVAPALG